MAADGSGTSSAFSPVTNWRIHLVNLTVNDAGQVAKTGIVAACNAVTKQIHNDFQKVWNVTGEVFHDSDLENWIKSAGPTQEMADGLIEKLQGLQSNEAVLYLVDKPDNNSGGYHFVTAISADRLKTIVDIVFSIYSTPELSLGKHPYSFVGIYGSETWTLTLSHEVLELLADPYATRFSKPTKNGREYIIEVCDAVEAVQFAYAIDSIVVSDFVYPQWFEEHAKPGTQLDHKRYLRAPFEILEDGYISYKQNGRWYQTRWFRTATPEDTILGKVGGFLVGSFDKDGRVSVRFAKYAKQARTNISNVHLKPTELAVLSVSPTFSNVDSQQQLLKQLEALKEHIIHSISEMKLTVSVR